MNDNVKLQIYLDSIPKGKYTAMRKTISLLCGVSNNTISQWLSGRTKIPLLAKKEIEQIARRKIF